MVFRRQLSSGVLTPSRGKEDSVRRCAVTHWLQGSDRGCSKGQRRESREEETLQGREPDRNCLGNRKTSSEHGRVGVGECSLEGHTPNSGSSSGWGRELAKPGCQVSSSSMSPGNSESHS